MAPRPPMMKGIMTLHALAACLVAFVLVPTCSGAGMKVKAKTKDPWDDPSDGGGGGEEAQAAPAESQESEMSPQDRAAIIEKFQEKSAEKRAHNQHQVMSQFMKTFANNMRLSVLADSQGDMPEEQRQRLIAKAESEKAAQEGGDPIAAPPPPEADSSEEPPPPRQRRSRMLNMAAARAARHQRQHAQRKYKLLPEAEGIGFPPPEGMAPDPAGEGMTNDPGMTAPADADSEAPIESEEAPEVPRPRPRRHHLRMLNVRPNEKRKAARRPSSSRKAQKLPPGVVRDEMGRAMPLLFIGSKPHSAAFHSIHVHLGAFAVACLALVLW